MNNSKLTKNDKMAMVKEHYYRVIHSFDDGDVSIRYFGTLKNAMDYLHSCESCCEMTARLEFADIRKI